MLGIQLVNVTVVRIIFLSTTKTNFYGIRCYSCVKINGKRMFAVVVKKYNVNEFDPFLLWSAFWMATTFSWMWLYVQLKAQPAIKYLIHQMLQYNIHIVPEFFNETLGQKETMSLYIYYWYPDLQSYINTHTMLRLPCLQFNYVRGCSATYIRCSYIVDLKTVVDVENKAE